MMSNLRPLASKTSQSVGTSSHSLVGIGDIAGSTSQNPRKRHTARQWDEVKPLILELYTTHTLQDTIDIVRAERGFDAGVRQYKNKLAEWSSEKYLKEPERVFLLDKDRYRKEAGKPKTEYVLRGTLLDRSVLERLGNRYAALHSDTQLSSPGVQVTPNGLEYYTPASPLLAKNGFAQTPQVFSPVTRLSGHVADLIELAKEEALIAAILEYDRNAKHIKIIIARNGSTTNSREKRAQDRQSLRTEQQDMDRLHARRRDWAMLASIGEREESHAHKHSRRHFIVAGMGRFANAKLLEQALWRGYNLAQSISATLEACEQRDCDPWETTNSQDTHLLQPSYCIVAQPVTFAPSSVAPILKMLKSTELIRVVLGLTNVDRNRWIGPWERVKEDEAMRVAKISGHVFGFLSESYPRSQILSVLVTFGLGQERQQECNPMLLRFSFSQSTDGILASCDSCNASSFMLDFIGPSGACKIRVPLLVRDQQHVLAGVEDLHRAVELKHTKSTARWSTLANTFEGERTHHLVRRCYCDGNVHANGFKPHYIDLRLESATKHEVWDPSSNGFDQEGRVFEAFPLNGDASATYGIVNSYNSDGESENEHWDPYGQEGQVAESFDAHPPGCELDDVYVSKPIFPKFSPHFI